MDRAAVEEERVAEWQRDALRQFTSALAAAPAGDASPWLRERFWLLEPRTRHAIVDEGEAGALFLDLIHPLSVANGGPRTAASDSDALAAWADIPDDDDAGRLAVLLGLIDRMGR